VENWGSARLVTPPCTRRPWGLHGPKALPCTRLSGWVVSPRDGRKGVPKMDEGESSPRSPGSKAGGRMGWGGDRAGTPLSGQVTATTTLPKRRSRHFCTGEDGHERPVGRRCWVWHRLGLRGRRSHGKGVWGEQPPPPSQVTRGPFLSPRDLGHGAGARLASRWLF